MNLSVHLHCHLELSTQKVGCQPFDQESVPRFHPLYRNRQFQSEGWKNIGYASGMHRVHAVPTPYCSSIYGVGVLDSFHLFDGVWRYQMLDE